MRNHKILQMTHFAAMQGVTMIELTVVLLILVALAGVTIPMFTGTPRYAQCVATDATMANIRDAIMGSGGQAGYRSDMGLLPFDSIATPAPSSLNYLFNNPLSPSSNVNNPPFNPSPTPAITSPTTQTFNPTTQRGWRGPYISGGMTCATIFSIVQTSITNGYTLPNNSDKYEIDNESVCNLPSVSTWVSTYTSFNNYTVALDSFPVIATNSSGDTSIALQGSPIVLMQDSTPPIDPNNPKYFLVSGGPTNGIEIIPSSMATGRHDDRVLYLNAPDPAGGNPSCSQ